MKKTTLALAISMTATQAVGAGFQLNSQSATGLGRAFAGDTVIADNASVVSKNAAAMSLIDQEQMSLGFVVIDSQVELNDTLYTPTFDRTQEVDNTQLDNTTYVPNFHYVNPIGDTPWTIGATVHSNFGTHVEFNETFPAEEFGGKTSLSSVNFGVSAAFQINEQWSVGAGLDAIYGEGEISRKDLLDIEADGVTFGFNLGATYQINQDHRFGLSYRFSPDLTATGQVDQLTSKTDSLDIPLPDMLEFSGYHKIQPNFALHYSVQYVSWSEFDALSSDGLSSPIKEYHWQDAGHISVGATWYQSPTTEYRVGYMYDVSPINQLTSLSIPDTNRHWFTFGLSHQLSKQWTIDGALGLLVGEEAHINESLTIIETSNIQSDVTTDAWMAGIQINYKF
ncbi:OmpP1/FadL family transporter [Vibrio sp. TBV020]|uniref:OmpP1/FadL family transporter n=1 Tax=Vibrio sp. TBV020 TaxID=3137398 RepID=UPI0038CDC92C